MNQNLLQKFQRFLVPNALLGLEKLQFLYFFKELRILGVELSDVLTG